MLLLHTVRPARSRCCTLLSCGRRAPRAVFRIISRAQHRQERRCCSVPRALHTAPNHICVPHEQVTAWQAAALVTHSETDQADLLAPSSARGNREFAGARMLQHALAPLTARMPLCRFLGAHSWCVPRGQVEAGAAGPLPPCHSWRGYRLARAQRQEQARADGRTDARSDGHVESALDGMGATQRTIPSIPTALICVSRPSRAQAEVGGSTSRARAAAHSACASARSRLVAGRYDRAADSVEACNDISDVDQEAPLVVRSTGGLDK